MALFPHPDRSREASLEMLQTLRRIAPSERLLAGTLAARCWNRSLGTASFGSCSSLASSRFLPRILRASFEGGLSVIALFRPSATRQRCFRSGEDALGRHQQTAGAPVHPKSRIESCLDGPPRSSVRTQPTLAVVGQASRAMDVADPAGLSSQSSSGFELSLSP